MTLQAGPELDAKIAELCGIDVVPCENRGRIVKKGEHYDQLKGVPYIGKYGDFFEPSTDLNAAFEAAEKCGLFTDGKRDDSLGYSGFEWEVNEHHFIDGMMQAKEIGSGPTPVLAICAAILALKGQA